MAFWDLLKGNDINVGVEEWQKTDQALLIDVRTAEEYCQGHIPGSISIPLDRIQTVTERVADKNTPLFVHCLSGVRSGHAVSILKQLGYTNVKNIGGISAYRGKVER